ncbi:MAG: hypothetical protein U0807_12590 [Candidatus Binatia bacterium]
MRGCRALVLVVTLVGVFSLPAAAETLVADLNPGGSDMPFRALTAARTRLFFDEWFGRLWTSDGTAAGTVTVANVLAQSPAAVDDDLYFSSPGGAFATWALWTSDGTAPGTHRIAIVTGHTVCHPIFGTCIHSDPFIHDITGAGGSLFFLAGRSDLWHSDGTEAGTVQLASWTVGFCRVGGCGFFGQELRGLTRVNGTAFFTGDADVLGEALGLMKSDGTTVVQVRADVAPSELVAARGTLFFTAPGSTGWALWRSDGTAAGTREVASTGTGVPARLTAATHAVFFVVHDEAGAGVLWRSDGTAAGTTPLAAVDATNLTAVDDTLFFTADSALWASDGTPLGTAPVAPVAASDLTAAGDLLYFVAADSAAGAELWESDGTGPGTQRVADINPGPADAAPEQLSATCNRLYFTAVAPLVGRELWTTDVSGGPPCGTDPASCTQADDCLDDGDACTVVRCDPVAGCVHDGVVGGAPGVGCLLDAPGSEAASCPGETVPRSIARRLDRARTQLASARTAPLPATMKRRVRRLVHTLERTEKLVTRAAARGDVSTSCADGLGALVTGARTRAAEWYASLP